LFIATVTIWESDAARGEQAMGLSAGIGIDNGVYGSGGKLI